MGFGFVFEGDEFFLFDLMICEVIIGCEEGVVVVILLLVLLVCLLFSLVFVLWVGECCCFLGCFLVDVVVNLFVGLVICF